MIPKIKTTRENGATVAIPGGHLWGAERAPQVEEMVCVEMEVGECFVLLGSLYHGGGTNSTSDVRRILHGLFFPRGHYRQEENIYIANRPEDVLSWSVEAQKLLGIIRACRILGIRRIS
jgi:ectoine hydroxylase-related dioxygenase (phytanoyl-CoA dioxygenase family)